MMRRLVNARHMGGSFARFCEGHYANCIGRPIGACPYRRTSAAADEWLNGWRNAAANLPTGHLANRTEDQDG